MAETAKLQLFVKVPAGRWGGGSGAQGGGSVGTAVSGEGGEGWVSVAVSAPLPLGWAGSGSPSGAESNGVSLSGEGPVSHPQQG